MHCDSHKESKWKKLVFFLPQMILFFCASCPQFTTWALKLNWDTFKWSIWHREFSCWSEKSLMDILSFLREWHFGQPVLNVPVQHIQTLPLDTSSYAEVGMASRDGISSTGFQLIPNSQGRFIPHLYICFIGIFVLRRFLN